MFLIFAVLASCEGDFESVNLWFDRAKSVIMKIKSVCSAIAESPFFELIEYYRQMLIEYKLTLLEDYGPSYRKYIRKTGNTREKWKKEHKRQRSA